MLTLKQGLIASGLSVLNQVIRRMIGIVSLVILARNLTPADFGLVAIALIFLNFVEVITSTGGASYLLSRKTLEETQVFTNWTLNFILKNAVAGLLAAASFIIADFYDDPRLIPILWVFVVQIFVNSIASPGLIFKQKKQQMGKIVQWQIASRLVTTGVTIFIAVTYKTYWALVIGQFLAAASGTLSSYIIAPMKPKWTLENVKQQWQFSKWIVPNSILSFGKTQIDAIYVSGSFETKLMGAYNSMKYYAMIPATLIMSPVIGQTLTQFSEFKDNKNYLTNQLQVSFFLMSVIVQPIIVLAVKDTPLIVNLVLGEAWVQYSSLLAIFIFMNIALVLQNLVSQVAVLHEATKLLTINTIAALIAQAGLLFLLQYDSIFMLAKYKVSLDVILSVGFYIFVLIKLMGFNAFSKISLPLFIPALSSLITVWLINLLPLPENLLGLIVFSLLYLALYGATQITLGWAYRDKIYCYGYLHKKASGVLKSRMKTATE